MIIILKVKKVWKRNVKAAVSYFALGFVDSDTGIDSNIFYAKNIRNHLNRFIIFAGGEMEWAKGKWHLSWSSVDGQAASK